MPISFKKKQEATGIWVKDDPSKPFEKCTDLTKLPPEVLAELEKQGYDEDDASKVYKFQVGEYTYRFSVFRDEWQCSRWKSAKGGSGSSKGGWGKTSGPREWSFLKMVDFEFGNLNDLHDIVLQTQLEDDESWEILPYVHTNSKNEPFGVIKKMKRINMVGSSMGAGSDTKESSAKESNKEESEETAE